MGHRLSKIVTRTGDGGQTGLTTGERVDKFHPRVSAMGEVDELNCVIGLLLIHPLPEALRERLQRVQHELFDLGGELSMPGRVFFKPEAVLALDQALDDLNRELPPLKEFVLPGGTPASAQAHQARAVARRAERSLWALHAAEPLNPDLMRYLNRLSDYLFVAARVLLRGAGGDEVGWRRSG
ncbi:MAG TPA: cob(I)yrinic acid a,c-diamide adenosyltransferase [Nevskiaceae bacterium]|nr:cob(I)yrinic acid a,c-diamide adenosyltransferase [Nevskiaceae bacterium]